MMEKVENSNFPIFSSSKINLLNLAFVFVAGPQTAGWSL